MIIALEYYNYRFFANDLVIEKGRRMLKQISYIKFFNEHWYNNHPYIPFSLRELHRDEIENYFTSIKNAEYLIKELYSHSNNTPIFIPCTENEKDAYRVPDYNQMDMPNA